MLEKSSLVVVFLILVTGLKVNPSIQQVDDINECQG